MSHLFTVIAEGFVSRRQPNTPTSVAAGSRCIVAPNGDLVCTFMVQSKLAANDYQMLLARSYDGGLSWTEQGPIWPHLYQSHAVFCSVSRAPDGELFCFGERTKIDQPGELYWCEATQGQKQNEIFWARSGDSGKTWTEPTNIPLPISGSAEAPGAMCLTRSGAWICCYSPYNTADPAVIVDRNQVVVLRSDDRGATWQHQSMLRFPEKHSVAGEAWAIELSDGRLLGTCWHIDSTEKEDFPNPYALSLDGGLTWGPTRSTGILGQSTALAPLPDGRALLVYNQRKHGEIGVWLALARPTETDFGIEANEIIWRAETQTQNGTSGEHKEWADFSFGEPSITPLPDGTLLATLWCIQPSGCGIRYVKLRINE